MDQKLLEEYQAVMDQNPFAVMLGIEFLEIEKGIARARVKKKKMHLDNAE